MYKLLYTLYICLPKKFPFASYSTQSNAIYTTVAFAVILPVAPTSYYETQMQRHVYVSSWGF